MTFDQKSRMQVGICRHQMDTGYDGDIKYV
jgi:hypothetical protein